MWLASHFIAIPLSYLLILILSVCSRRLTKQNRILVLRILFLVVIFSEAVKQALGVLNNLYSPAYLPFHYSTTYYVSLGLCAFGSERQRHYGRCSLLVGGVLLLITMTYHPFAVVGDCAQVRTSWYSLHSLLYHDVALLAFFMMLANGEYVPQRRDDLRYLSFLYAWAAIAVPAARVTKTNYAGLLESYIPFLEALRLSKGDQTYLFTYALFASLLAVLILRAYALIYRYVIGRMQKNTEKEQGA